MCICSDSSPMSPALLPTSVLHGARAGPVSTRWGSSPTSPRSWDSSPSRPASAPAPHPAVPRPALHSTELTLLQAVLFIPCLPPLRQLCGSSRIVSFYSVVVFCLPLLLNVRDCEVSWLDPCPQHKPGTEHMCSQHVGMNTPVTVLREEPAMVSLVLPQGDC